MAREIAEAEIQAGENAAHLLTLIEQGQRSNLATWVDGRTRTELAWMVLALGQGLLEAESERDRLIVSHAVLRRQNETLDTANEALFHEKRELSERVSQLRSILDARAAASTATKQRREAA